MPLDLRAEAARYYDLNPNMLADIPFYSDRLPGVLVTQYLTRWLRAAFPWGKRAATTFGEIDTAIREASLDWDISDSLFIDGREVRVGPSRPTSSSKA